jgi:hypothetical protein
MFVFGVYVIRQQGWVFPLPVLHALLYFPARTAVTVPGLFIFVLLRGRTGPTSPTAVHNGKYIFFPGCNGLVDH